ncbi:transposase [Neolewinella persica]|uniref:transposase n=1 Tax=Neolewinella persica TaxID=70998 RepID=UPI00036F99B1|nr:transposase [Neolewinella persica]
MAHIDDHRTVFHRLLQPHYQLIGGVFSVTIKTHDAIPAILLTQLQSRRIEVLQEIAHDRFPNKRGRHERINELYYQHLEKLTHARRTQEHPFNNSRAAEAVIERLKRYDGQYYKIVAYALLSNHLHLLLDFSIQCPKDWDFISPIPSYRNLASVIGKIKGGSANDVNKSLGRKGKLWAPGYYDRYIRNRKHFMQEFWYIMRNAEQAGVVNCFQEHPYTFGDPIFLG